MKEKLLQLFYLLNPALLLAPIIPLVYRFGFADDVTIGYELFLLSLLIIIPIVLISYFAKKCRHFITFFVSCLLTMTVMSFLLYYICIAIWNNEIMIGVSLLFTLEEIAVFIHHFRIRLTFAEQLEDEGKITKSIAHDNIFTRPSLYALMLLGAYYFLAMGFGSREVCNEIFLTGFIYIFMFIVYEFLIQTKDYLSIHNDVAGIPKKRVYGIGAGMVGVLLIIVFMAMLPSAILINKRPYYDLRNILNYNEETRYEMEMPEFSTEKVAEDNGFEKLMEGQEIKEWPAWAKALSQIIIGGLLLVVIMMLLKEVFRALKRFEISYDDNGDIIESLDEDDIMDTVYINEMTKETSSQTKKIRRQYKKAIKKARKELPNPYESPLEMEEIAGIKDEEWMKQLHVKYEEARYNKGV